MPFLNEPILQRLATNEWKLVEPLVYKGSRDTIVIPAGFRTDLASVPQMFESLTPRMGPVDLAAILHDYLCEDRRIARETGRQPMFSSRDVDGIFYRVCREQGVPLRVLYWLGVRWGALFSPWRRQGWWRSAYLVLPLSAAILWLLGAIVLLLHALVSLLLVLA